MPGVMLRPCFRRLSASSARPVRAADPRRSMSSDDGGVGTVSSSVRRARSSRGSLAGVPCLDLDDVAPGLGAVDRAAAAGAGFCEAARFAPMRRAARMFPDVRPDDRRPAAFRLDRPAAARLLADRAELFRPLLALRRADRFVAVLRLAMSSNPFGTLTVWR